MENIILKGMISENFALISILNIYFRNSFPDVLF